MKTAGLTGCSSGWLILSLGDESFYRIVEESDELIRFLAGQDRVFVDVPIGLVDDEPFRPCDRMLAERLGTEGGEEVVPPPIRSSLEAPSYVEANMDTYERTGQPLSVKSWRLVPRIRLLDQLLRENPGFDRIVLESHPELLLNTLNGQPIYQKKGTKKGLRHRVDLVAEMFPEAADFFREIKEEYRRNEVEEIDIVRAAALAWGANASVRNGLSSLPSEPDPDPYGLLRTIHYISRS